MNTECRLSYRATSLAVAFAYAVCIAVFLNLYFKEYHSNTKLIRLFTLWCWIIAPQLVLFLYVSKFLARWAQCISLLLQIGLCFSLRDYGIPALTDDYEDIKYEAVFVLLPIWHYGIVAVTGLVMKIVQDY